MFNGLVWQAREPITVEVVGEFAKPITVEVRPVVTYHWHGITVGLLMQQPSMFGYWFSSNSCDLITAWQTAQMLPKLKTLRISSGYGATLCSLVLALRGDGSQQRRTKLAEDFVMTMNELQRALDLYSEEWPSASLLSTMWEKLPVSEQDRTAPLVETALKERRIYLNEKLMAQVDAANARLNSDEQRKQYENRLTDAGFDDKPLQSLKQFMVDIGVTNLAYTIGYGEMFEPSHFKMEDLDREVLTELIGSTGFHRLIPLVTTAKQPDDPSAHYQAGGGGVTIFGSNFGESTPPKVKLGRDGQVFDLVSVAFDRERENFQLAIRPVNVDPGVEGKLMSVETLRALIGSDMGLKGPLPPGTPAPWVETSKPRSRGFFGRR